MAEPTCVMHPISYTSPAFSSEIQEENNPMYGVGESVSFGRYMTDNLEWERWSSFKNSNRNRYVEEAKVYSKPGSVAQKKAYFEAHFKRMAALKAAALLEQGNAVEGTSAGKPDCDTVDSKGQNVQNSSSSGEVQAHDYIEAGMVPREGKHKGVEGYVIHKNDLYSVAAENEVKLSDDKDVHPMVPSKSFHGNEPSLAPTMSTNDENLYQIHEGRSRMTLTDKPPIQEKASYSKESVASIVKKNPPLASFMSPTVGGTRSGGSSLFGDSAAKYTESVYPGKENFGTPIKQKSSVTDPDKKKTPLRMSINREINKIISPVIKKIGSSSRGSKDCNTPLKTPAKASVNGISETPPMTPSRGSRSRLDSSTCQRKTGGSRWHIFSGDASMSPSIGRYKISSPIIPNSFCLNGDRAARRKQKLEDKFNATATEKAPQTSKFKVKAEAELNKFRQSFCFKAMSSPDYYRESETLRSPKQKMESTHGEYPKRERQPSQGTSRSKFSLPPRRPTVKESGSKSVPQKYSSGLRTIKKL